MVENILITGGAGFIGSHLADRLLSEGCKVVVLDNLSRGRLSNLDAARQSPHFSFVEGDILDEGLLDDLFSEYGFDMVFHLAANSDIASSHANPDVDLDATFLTTYRILKAMMKHQVKKIMFASTSAIYGQTGGAEVNENYGRCFRLPTMVPANWPARRLSPVLWKITELKLGLPVSPMFAANGQRMAFCMTLSKNSKRIQMNLKF